MGKLLKNKRGIVGIEAAIVLIAFIIIAAALSYVVINMGFYTTQKTRDAMASGLEESLNALQLDGVVTAKTDENGHIEWIVFPVKLSAGRASMDLKNGTLALTAYLPNATLLNIYKGVFNETEYGSDPVNLDKVLVNMTTLFASSTEKDYAMSIIYNDDGDTVLELTEKAFFIIHLDKSPAAGGQHTLADYEVITLEVKGAKGAALTIERLAPGGMLPHSYVNLG
ncbi:MAG: archaellin/type IV pilin N-terminal domain-containing protein [Candidatus Bathyarchaeia archaeon]